MECSYAYYLLLNGIELGAFYTPLNGKIQVLRPYWSDRSIE
ncbi:hypothetical protein A1Q_0569 [Vibrio campbellii HY01]|nr:hypothetical protein A1Q_0569 [Vibrio campbellii HY01]